MYIRTICSTTLFVTACSYAFSQDDATKAKGLLELKWAIGVWEHINPDEYDAVSNLEIRWGKDRKTIEVQYQYHSNPGFDEKTDFHCSEVLRVGDYGSLLGKYEYRPIAGGYVNLVLDGEYKLTRTKTDKWEGKGSGKTWPDGSKKVSEWNLIKKNGTEFTFGKFVFRKRR